MPDQCKFQCEVLSCSLIFCNNNNTWYGAWGPLSRDPWLSYSLALYNFPKVRWMCPEEDQIWVEMKFQVECGSHQPMVAKSCLEAESSFWLCWSKGGARCGHRWTRLRIQHWQLESGFGLHQTCCTGDRDLEGCPAFLERGLRKSSQTVFLLILLSCF